MVVIAGASNAVNLSDGLDGLASGLLIVSFLVFAVIAYACGTEMSAAVGLTPVAHSAEIVVVCAAVVGGCVGFCGLTRRRPGSSWATPVLWRWARCSAPFRS